AEAHIPPICAVPTRDVADVEPADVGERSANKYIAASPGDGEHAIRAAGAAHGTAAHRIPVRSIPARDAVGQRFARRGEKSADINPVVRLADAGDVDGGS